MSILFQNVSKSFGSKDVLRDVSFEVRTGEILFVIGKSGVGKSVTLKHIVGVLKPSSGKVLVDGCDVTQATEDQLAGIRKTCGMVFQHPALFDSLNVFDNVAFGLPSRDPLKNRARVIETLRLVNIDEEVLDRYPPELSYGMQKRVSLARTLAPGPSYLLFDEPTTSLDPISTNAICDLIQELSRKLKVTSVVVSHDMGCALRISDRILVLDDGKVLAHAPVQEIRNSRTPLIQEFLAEALV